MTTVDEVPNPVDAVEDLLLGRPPWLDEMDPDLGTEEMETQDDAISKKRKADVSPVISISSEEEVVAPYSLRGSRKCRIVASPKDEKIDLTRLSKTPIRSDDASVADRDDGTAGLSQRGKTGNSVRFRTKKSLVQITPLTPKIDLKP
ncbi:unnamed protein product [Lasius platythorax]|uniref:Uncharacterized protein n=1 Tax=Lasius platythorax TaxID=488582 RepID=A0AAV2MXZ5_9HYME